jgi:ADP-ribosylglycohydrolase
LIVGDALGVPVEFTSREERRADPVVDMREYGTHNQPRGTWSDDSSMTLATVDSLKTLGKIDYKDIMDKFGAWCLYGDYTPFGELFDIGGATTRAIVNYGRGADPTSAGGKSESDNGNGSLMRILPICLFMFERQKKVCTSEDESIYAVHTASALTHAHIRSQIACGIYYFLVKAILEQSGTALERLQEGINNAYIYYRRDMSNLKELDNFNRMIDLNEFKTVPEDEIRSSGYVVDTLEAAVWCLLNTDSFAECVLKAVNLGDDTDTVAAVAGGLAGLFYGYDSIPVEWIDVIQKKEWIEELIRGL